MKLASRDPAVRPGMHAPITPPVVDEKYEYYEVRGVSASELRSQLCEHGCRWKDGRTYDAVTTWHIRWDYGHDCGPQVCKADSFRAIVDITYRYPRWVGAEDAPLQLVEKWSRYLDSLVRHEEGHRDLAVAAAAELTRSVEALAAQPTCADLDREVRALARAWTRRLKEEEKEYDAGTVHGVLQGAAFP